MKKLLFKHSKNKFYLAFLFALASFQGFGAVVTGNMTPMSFYPGSVDQAIYDLDNNGQFDFKVRIVYLGSSNYTFVFKGLNGTKFETDGSLELIGYNDGTPLGGNSYQDSGFVKSLFFPEGTIKYVGLTFKINGVSHCAYVGARTSSYYQGFFDLWTFGYETNSAICINANASSSSAGIEKQDANFTSKVFPNPSTGQFKMDLEKNIQDAKFTITDALGKQISFELSKNEEGIFFVIDAPSGIYFLLVSEGEKREVLRIIKD